VLAAVSLPLVYWAQTARGYGPMVAFSCAGFAAFIALADPPAGEVPGRRPWIGYVAAMTLAMYCSFVAALVIPAQLVVLARRRQALRRFATAVVALAVCCVPLAVLALHRGSGQLFWVSRPMKMVDVQVLQSLTSGGLAPSFHHAATTYVLMWGTAAAMLVILADAIRRGVRGEPVWRTAMTLAWCLVPVSVTFVYSLLAQPIFVPRNLLISTPAVALALAATLRDRRLPRMAAAVTLLVVLGLRAVPVAASYGVSPEPWAEVARDVLAVSRPGDCVAFYPQDGRMAFQYYVGTGPGTARAPRSILPVVAWGRVRSYVEDYVTLSPAQLVRRAAGCTRMWLISSHEGQRNAPAQSRAHLAGYHRFDSELERVFGSAPIRKYGYASTIHVQLLPGRR
jgi:mannosyltransferase